jgi:hypothetical protein
MRALFTQSRCCERSSQPYWWPVTCSPVLSAMISQLECAGKQVAFFIDVPNSIFRPSHVSTITGHDYEARA